MLKNNHIDGHYHYFIQTMKMKFLLPARLRCVVQPVLLIIYICSKYESFSFPLNNEIRSN